MAASAFRLEKTLESSSGYLHYLCTVTEIVTGVVINVAAILYAEGQFHYDFYGELLHSDRGPVGVVPGGDRRVQRCQSDEPNHVVA